MPDLFIAKKLYFSMPRLPVLRIVSILIVSMIGISDSAFAEVLDKYCLSSVGQTEPIEESERVIPQHPVPPHLNREVNNLPELYEKSCSRIAYFFDMCTRKTFFSYSPTLDRVFFKGYRPTSWGGGFVHLEISEEGTKSVPSELVNSGFSRDIPALNGVLFGGRFKKEALFYDGNKITNFSQYFPNQNDAYLSNLHWYFTETSNERFFLVVDFVGSKKEPFLMELEPEANFTLINVPKDLRNTFLRLFALPNDSRVWGITINSILYRG